MHNVLMQIGRIPFNQQIRNFENTLDQITGNLGAATVAPVVARCIFFVGMGSNDYLNNYLMPNYPTRSQYNSRQFADLLTQQYTQQLSVRSSLPLLSYKGLFSLTFRTYVCYRGFTTSELGSS